MVARDITIDGDPDEVWEALTDPELLAEWLGDGGQAVVEEAEPERAARASGWSRTTSPARASSYGWSRCRMARG